MIVVCVEHVGIIMEKNGATLKTVGSYLISSMPANVGFTTSLVVLGHAVDSNLPLHYPSITTVCGLPTTSMICQKSVSPTSDLPPLPTKILESPLR
jgi:hypothetical protein